MDNWKKNIRLGLDLKGGSQLVLQVQLQDAFKAEADTVIQRLKDELAQGQHRLRGDDAATIRIRIQAADTIQIDIKGVPATKAGNFRPIVNDNFSGDLDSDPGEPDRLPDDHAAQRSAQAASRTR